jgi:hypothetical protein
MILTFWRLAFHILLVAIIEWERLFPVMKLFPVMEHTLGIDIHSVSVKISALHILSYLFQKASRIYAKSTTIPGTGGLGNIFAFYESMW